ncbi:hypothetical protein A4E84_23540 [Streptomyces qaidamensis]|uniref:Uncharacterized protein n=1 Tax=Streptomyces qaidamensis TaxID=1783515 RepID=A0A143C5G7_9ACTN|nr:hypothetical protein [Streptomyces qaidamensis]AMW12205.1 hypothetical protein A4E84_23540 [Streptomyces qaidamensis]
MPPELFERFRAEDRTSEAFIYVWALIALPAAGLLHTPQALVRRARIKAGWTLIAGYWMYFALMAALAWQVQGFFPAHDAPGKNGGLFGAAILLVIGTPLFAVGSGAVFRDERDATTPGLREHVTAVTILCCTLTGLVAGLTFGYNFALPRNGYPAMFLPGGALWGLLAGAALGMRAGALLTSSANSRRRMTDDAKSFARTPTALLGCCLCVSQLGWLLPTWAMALVGLPAPFALFLLAGRYEWLARWVEYRQIEVPKEAMY